jgi:hypothetical protein
MSTPPTKNHRQPNEPAELGLIVGAVVACMGAGVILFYVLEWLGFYRN